MRTIKAPALHWSKRENRWRFRYRGKNFAVSPKALNCEKSPSASKEAAERWRDERVIEADNAADSDYSQSAARLQLLWSRDHAERCLAQMERIGQHHAVRQWRNILAVIYAQLAERSSFPDGYDADPEEGLELTAPRSIVDTAVNRLLTHDLEQREKFSKCFRIPEHRLHAPLPAEQKVPTIREAVEEFLEGKKSDNTVEYVSNLRRDLERLCTIVGDDLEVTALNADSVRKIRQQVQTLATTPTSRDDTKRRTKKPWNAKTTKNVLATIRQFIKWCCDEEHIERLPKNLKHLGVKVSNAEVQIYDVAEFRTLFEAATGNNLLRLSLLLMANCGYTQKDISDLKRKEISNGRITRKRSKTQKHASCPVVSYRLWPITNDLLQAELGRHNHAELAILDRENRPLKTVLDNPQRRGGVSKLDVLKNEFRSLRENHDLPVGRTLKHIRKTGASLIANKFGDGVAKHFLGHCANGVAEVSYLKRDQNQLDEAINWLGKELGLVE